MAASRFPIVLLTNHPREHLAGGSRKWGLRFDILPVPMGQLDDYSGRQGIHGILKTGFTTVNSFHTPPADVSFVTGKI